mgnify:FL=1
MAGRGTRLRPQTLVTPKPLIEFGGKTIIQRIVDLFSSFKKLRIDKLGFVIERKDDVVEDIISNISRASGIAFEIFYQGDPKGTAHAIYSARKMLKGPTLIAFADTVFESPRIFDFKSDGCLFVSEVTDPSSYGVVVTNTDGSIKGFVEKPSKPISNLALVGVYYFKQGEILSQEIDIILKNNTLCKGEYQLTTALENLRLKNLRFTTHKINNWLDFGTVQNLINSHKKLLIDNSSHHKKFKNTIIKEPCHIGPNVSIQNSVIGPFVSIGSSTKIFSSVIDNSIIQSDTVISDAKLSNSLIGKSVVYNPNSKEVNIGDYSTFKK